MAKVLQIIIKAIDQATGPLSRVKGAVQGFGGAAQTGAGQAAGLSGNLATLGIQAAALGVTFAAVSKITKEVFEFGEEGAQLMRLETAGEQLAAGMGESFSDMQLSMQHASLGMISDADLIASANQAMMLGVSATAAEMANLTEIAAFRARAMGISTTQALNDITRGIGRMSPLILDNLGIIIDARTRYKEYADSMGIAVTEITAMEKRQILLTAVLEDGNKQLELAGGLAKDAAGEFEELNANWQNLMNNLKEGAAGPLTWVVKLLNMSVLGTRDLGESTQLLEMDVRSTTGSYEEYKAAIDASAKSEGLTIDVNGDLVHSYGNVHGAQTKVIAGNVALTEAQYNVNKVYAEGFGFVDGWSTALGKATKEVDENEEALKRELKAQEALSSALYALEFALNGPIAAANEDYRKDLDKINAKLVEEKDKLQELIEKHGEYDPAVEESREKIRGFESDIVSLGIAHGEVTAEIIIDIFLARAEREKASIAEVGWLTDVAVASGVVAQADVDRAEAVARAYDFLMVHVYDPLLIEMLEQGVAVEDLERVYKTNMKRIHQHGFHASQGVDFLGISLDALPKEVNIRINTHYQDILHDPTYAGPTGPQQGGEAGVVPTPSPSPPPGITPSPIPGEQEYQHGTEYVPQTGWAYLHLGEAVLTQQENAERQRGGEGDTFYIQANYGYQSEKTLRDDIRLLQLMSRV